MGIRCPEVFLSVEVFKSPDELKNADDPETAPSEVDASDAGHSRSDDADEGASMAGDAPTRTLSTTERKDDLTGLEAVGAFCADLGEVQAIGRFSEIGSSFWTAATEAA